MTTPETGRAQPPGRPGTAHCLSAREIPRQPQNRPLPTTTSALQVPDPYRWLEEPRLARNQGLGDGPERGHVRLPEPDSVPRQDPRAAHQASGTTSATACPSRWATQLVFSKNDGLQNQAVLYRQRGAGEPHGAARPQQVLGRWHHGPGRHRVQQRPPLPGLRHQRRRLRLAPGAHPGPDHQPAAARNPGLGEGVGHVVGRTTASTTAATTRPRPARTTCRAKTSSTRCTSTS